jgi:NAD(P)H dehydrogenase (quinone)
MMMKQQNADRSALIVLAHPERQSFNGFLADRAATTFHDLGLSTSIADLYREGFDPVEGPQHYPVRRSLDRFIAMDEQRYSSAKGQLPNGVASELARVRNADLVIFQFPMWWYGPPAILKGWFDRVMLYGETYSSEKRYDRGVFRGRNAILSVTTGSPRNVFSPGRDGDIDFYLWPIHFMLYYLGFTVWPAHVCYGIRGNSPPDRSSNEYRELITNADALSQHVSNVVNQESISPMEFNGWHDWDSDGKLLPTAKIKFPFSKV